MTRVFPVVVLLELDPELELELEHAPTATASKQAVATAKSHLVLCNLLISLVFLSSSIGYGLFGRRFRTSPWPGDEVRCCEVQVPAGRAPRVRNLRQGRVLPSALVISERAPEIERAALRGRAFQVLRPS
jgi:hypothetical protein